MKYLQNIFSSTKQEEVPLTWMFWRKRRYIVVLLAFLGYVSNYSLRVNLSVAIVAMTQNRSVNYGNGTIVNVWKWPFQYVLHSLNDQFQEQYFNWNTQERGLILSSFFWGYIFTQLAGGFFAKRFGGNLVCVSDKHINLVLNNNRNALLTVDIWLRDRSNSYSILTYAYSNCTYAYRNYSNCYDYNSGDSGFIRGSNISLHTWCMALLGSVTRTNKNDVHGLCRNVYR